MNSQYKLFLLCLGLLALPFMAQGAPAATPTNATSSFVDNFYNSLPSDQQALVLFNEQVQAIVAKAEQVNSNWYKSLNLASRKDLERQFVNAAAGNLEAKFKLQSLEISKNLSTSTRDYLAKYRDSLAGVYNIKGANVLKEYEWLSKSGMAQDIISANELLDTNKKTWSKALNVYGLNTNGNGAYEKLDKAGKAVDKGTVSVLKSEQTYKKNLQKPTMITRLLSKDCFDDITSPDRYFKNLKDPRTIDTIIVHTSYYQPDNDVNIKRISSDIYSVDGILQVWNYYGVGPHYLIDRNGIIYKTAEEKNVAWHAGKSLMPLPDGREGVGIFSLGIELLNGENDNLTEEQKASLAWLVKDIQSRYDIKHVLGHNDIANKAEDAAFRDEVNKLGTIGNNIKTDPWGLVWHQINLLMKGFGTQYGH